MIPVSAVFFDLDGTLIDSLPDITAAANAALAPLGAAGLSHEQVRPHVGQGAARLLANLLHIDDPQDAIVEAATQRFMRFYETHVADSTRLYPGILEMLAHFAPVPLVVISNKSTRLAKAALESLAIADRFEAIYGGDAFERKKPDPLPLVKAAELVRVPLQEALMVGDSTFDILAGLAARARTCGVTWGLGSESSIRSAGAERVVHHPAELMGGYRPWPRATRRPELRDAESES